MLSKDLITIHQIKDIEQKIVARCYNSQTITHSQHNFDKTIEERMVGTTSVWSQREVNSRKMTTRSRQTCTALFCFVIVNVVL